MTGDTIPPDIASALHQRLLSGDVTASAEVAETFLPILIERLREKFSWVFDPHLIETAADEALLSYILRPTQYNPSKLSLERYLLMSARYDLRNLLARHNAEYAAPNGKEIVELDAPNAEHEIEAQAGLSVEDQVQILASPVWQQLQELLPDPVDQEIVLMMMEDIRATKAYAEVLGIAHLTADEQAREVKRHKDRLKKHLLRHLKRSELEDHDG